MIEKMSPNIDKPLYLVIPMQGIAEFEKFEMLFSFYPEGVNGVVRDYLKALSDPEVLKSQETDDLEYIPCLAGDYPSEKELLVKIIAMYENSIEYKAQLHAYPNCQMEHVVETVCELICNKVQEVIYEYRDYFKSFKCEFDTPHWLGQSLAVKASRIPTYH